MNQVRVLIKEKILANNMRISCTKIDKIVISISTENGELHVSANVTVVYFKDKISYEEGIPPVLQESFLLSHLESDPAYENIAQFIFGSLLTKEDFIGAAVESATIFQPAPLLPEPTPEEL